MDNEDLEGLLKEWKKQFSKSRQRHYYFNPKTGESLWTLDEVKQKILKKSVKDKEKVANASELTSDTSKNSNNEAKVIGSLLKSESFIDYMAVDDEYCDPMDIEIVENICRIRFDSNENYHLGKNSNLNISNRAISLDDNEIKSYKLLLVIDTNIFISNLKQLSELKAKHKNEVIFSIPWIVLQELDYIKSNKSSGSNMNPMSSKARQAIQFISEMLDETQAHSSHRRQNCIFETSQQNEQQMDLIKCETNDDRIIKCALRHSIEYQNLKVILITNDKNLFNKSIVSNLQSASFNSLKTNISNWLAESSVKPVVNDDTFINDKNNNSPYKDADVEAFLARIATLIENQLMLYIFKSLSVFYEIEMKKAYNNLWQDLLINKPPWINLRQLLVNFEKSFSALFCFDKAINANSLKQKFSSFKDNFSQYTKMHISFSSQNEKPLEKLKTCIKMSSELASFYDLFDKTSYTMSTFESSYQYLEFYIFIGIKLCNIVNLIELINSDRRVLYENEPLANNQNIFLLFDPIWQRLNGLCELTPNLIESLREKHLNDSETEYSQLDELKKNFKIYFYYLLCYESIDDFKRFYENFLIEQNPKNVICLTHSIFALYKLLDIDTEQSELTIHHITNDQLSLLNQQVEMNKHQVIKSNLINYFFQQQSDVNLQQALQNGLFQLNEYKIKFEKLSKSTFSNFLNRSTYF